MSVQGDADVWDAGICAMTDDSDPPELILYFISAPIAGRDFQHALATEIEIVRNASVVNDPVDLVMAAIREVMRTGGKIAALNISAHGGANRFKIGKTWVDLDSLPYFLPIFAMLRPHFTPNAVVSISGCGVAKDFRLLSQLSMIFRVKVTGWTGDGDVFKWWIFEGLYNEGKRIVCLNYCWTTDDEYDSLTGLEGIRNAYKYVAAPPAWPR